MTGGGAPWEERWTIYGRAMDLMSILLLQETAQMKGSKNSDEVTQAMSDEDFKTFLNLARLEITTDNQMCSIWALFRLYITQ